MTFLDSFLIRAALAGVGVALAAAPLGCLIVWRRMAYFGDATAHASILGVALALALNTSVFGGALVVALLMAATVSTLSGRGYAMDTLLGVMAHSALAIGLVAVSFLQGVRIDLMAYLFGDILAVGRVDLVVIWGGVAVVLGLLWWRWSAILTATLSPDLAHAAGIDPKREQLALTVALALVVAVAIKVVGVLLIAALLLIPAAAARPFAATPERMALIAAGIGAGSALAGLQLSYLFDTPTGPTIVCVAAGVFLLASIVTLGRRG
ncbi:metal ABC transporter permease [Marivivens marinus]|uniref:metal ABC transporter permease n=1 Tax=Marivivens marinus TaxID=3110173 RepID=UPI003B8450C5